MWVEQLVPFLYCSVEAFTEGGDENVHQCHSNGEADTQEQDACQVVVHGIFETFIFSIQFMEVKVAQYSKAVDDQPRFESTEVKIVKSNETMENCKDVK